MISYAAQLRQELSVRNAAFAKRRGLIHVCSFGEQPVIVYPPHSNDERHGNFIDTSYAAIVTQNEWKKRLGKAHAQSRSLPRAERRWKELDSCMSSDALLMNVFCHPSVLRAAGVKSMLGIQNGDMPSFGFPARVPLKSGRADRTEVDMKLGVLLVESKLTETDFQTKAIDVVESYRDLHAVFERNQLPRTDGLYASYQLIRNVLAAHALNLSFCVLLDARRPDLIEAWYAVMRCVRIADLRTKCKVLTWQELSEELPTNLRKFLDLKYGIVPPGSVATALDRINLPCGSID
jgi:hypothetical protein